MPYDIRAADSICVLLSDRHDVVEGKMMGSPVFMVGGNMCVVVSEGGGLSPLRFLNTGNKKVTFTR